MSIRLFLFTLSCLPTIAFANSDYAAWSRKNTDGSWTATTETAVLQSKLTTLLPNDIKRFCPAYESRSTNERAQFWVGLISAVAKPESNFKPETTYTESFNDGSGKKVISRGLLQISIESANQKRYSCGIEKAEDLHKPSINLTCGVRILAAWVEADSVIATHGTNMPKGGGRYWSTLREKRGHLPEISGFTNKLKVCNVD